MSLPLTVSVPFPSGRPQRKRLLKALDAVKEWGIHWRCPLLQQEQRWDATASSTYLAGSDEQRSVELLDILQDPNHAVAWCGRGGYGATRLLSRLAQVIEGLPPLPPTRLLGYSDITAIFALLRSLGCPVECVHAPVFTEVSDHPHPELLRQALQGEPCPLPVEAPGRLLKNYRGPIWGGNLAVLASLCGTPWLPEIRDSAIFLEDIEEAPYRIDRFLTQLHDSGFFSSCSGILLGHFSKCGSGREGVETAISRCRELGLEVLGELPVGHEPNHLPLFLDYPYEYDARSSFLRPSPLN